MLVHDAPVPPGAQEDVRAPAADTAALAQANRPIKCSHSGRAARMHMWLLDAVEHLRRALQVVEKCLFERAEAADARVPRRRKSHKALVKHQHRAGDVASVEG